MPARALRFAPYFLIPLIAIASLPYAAGDLACWTALGLKTLREGHLQIFDSFSILKTTPSVYPAWGATLIYAILYPRIGLAWLSWLHELIPVLILLWIYSKSIFRHETRAGWKLRGLVYLSWILIIPAAGERPSAFGLLFLVAAYELIARLRGRVNARQIVALVALQIAWVNFHGSFALLPVMLAWRLGVLAFNGRRHLSMAVALVAVIAAIGVNPFGFEVLPYTLQTAMISRARQIAEWERTFPWTDFPTGLFFYTLTAGVAALCWKASRRDRLRSVLRSPIFPLLLAGFTASRNTSLAFVVLIPFLMLHFKRLILSRSVEAGFFPHRLAPVLLLAAWIALMPPLKPFVAHALPESRRPLFSEETPMRLVQKIRESSRTGCPVFAEVEHGGILMLEAPGHPIFMDNRNINYGDVEYAGVLATLSGTPGWENYLRQFKTCFVMVDTQRHPALAGQLIRSAEWKPVDQEGPVALFEVR